ncbi:MAG: hypothetical protein RQ731_04580 [Anaerosomatales bacterium]|nr:hypothetical protein [Anaerosomatales bacterium]MDT8434018.1 hypothetical protein [Anaerosomatales bacterium]
MSRRGWIIVVAVLVLCLVAAGIWWYLDQPRRIAARAVRAYDVTLSRAVRELDPELLGDVATEEEKQRVASYITLLWGRAMALDATLESLEVTSAERNEDGSITVEVTEVWSYQDLELDSGKALGEPRRETMRLRYSLVRDDENWIVGRSELVETDTQAGVSR